MPSTFGVADPPGDIRILMTPQLILEDRNGVRCRLIASCYMPDQQSWSYETSDRTERVTRVSNLTGYQILGEGNPHPG